MNIIYGLLAIVVLLAIGVVISENRKAINKRTIVSGLILQVIFMLFVMKVPFGQKLLQWISKVVLKALSFGQDGINFVLGGVSENFVFGIDVLALICFTSALISLLYYFKVIPILVKVIGKSIAKIMGTTEVETFVSVANSFLGGTEAPLLVKPYLSRLTRSELFAVVMGGFSSCAVTVIYGYSIMGIDMQYILMAMVTVPFATLLMSKVIIPEVEESKTKNIEIEGSGHSSMFQAIGDGAINGLQVAISVGAVLIAFIGLISLLNYILGFIGMSLTSILGSIFTPIAYLLNIPSADITAFASAIGTKTAINEYVAIAEVGKIISTLSPRTQAILSISLMNFANFSFIGITIGAFSVLCKERRDEVAKFGIKALIGGVLTTLISGAMIGMFF